MFLSVFDLFKIGVGPSSSHTMGPMTAANMFLQELMSNAWPRPTGAEAKRLRATLFGSLAYTGVGHASDRAVILGLSGYRPETIDPERMDDIIAAVRKTGHITPAGYPRLIFNPDTDLVLAKGKRMPAHTNGLQFEALDNDGNLLLRRGYYSIGGGFVVREEDMAQNQCHKPETADFCDIPYPFRNGKAMLEMAKQSGLNVAAMKRANELTRISEKELDEGLERIFTIMSACVDRGLAMEGELPGGLKVKRRAKKLHDRLQADWKKNRNNPVAANDWLSVFAMAVNEENAAGGRIVTAPTNGAAGVIPAVLRYYLRFHSGADKQGVQDFLLTAAAIGGIIKCNASISGAEVGCQGEVGSASAMAAAGLTAALGGIPEQIENAAEIALEHHLGMTCDPIGGLVQVPCIERNALGAVKAVTASSLALHSDGSHFVPLDACIETMRQTGLDMHERYKETSEGGLAINIVDC